MKIAIISGKGGSGKSSITAAFIALSDHLIAIDCDVDASNLPLLFPHTTIQTEHFVSGQSLEISTEVCTGCGLCSQNCIYHALTINHKQMIAEANDLICEGCGLCESICPQQAISIKDKARSQIHTSLFAHGTMIHGNLYPGDDNSGKMIARLRSLADEKMEQENIQLQILDGPPGIGCPVISTVTGMDKVIIVCEPTLSGISDLKRSYHVAHSFCPTISVIINKADINSTNTSLITQWCESHQLPILAQIPFDRIVTEAQINCKSIINYAPHSHIAKILTQSYRKLIEN